jgi:cytochrome c
VVYADRGCAACHGDQGGGGPSGPLVGGGPLNATDRDPAKLIGNYWPYATTIFDFVRRAMPWQQPKTLTDNEVYAVTAYILALNKIHQRQRRDERRNAAESEDAESRRLRQPVSGQALSSRLQRMQGDVPDLAPGICNKPIRSRPGDHTTAPPIKINAGRPPTVPVAL